VAIAQCHETLPREELPASPLHHSLFQVQTKSDVIANGIGKQENILGMYPICFRANED
jgi:hypothetical protein